MLQECRGPPSERGHNAELFVLFCFVLFFVFETLNSKVAAWRNSTRCFWLSLLLAFWLSAGGGGGGGVYWTTLADEQVERSRFSLSVDLRLCLAAIVPRRNEITANRHAMVTMLRHNWLQGAVPLCAAGGHRRCALT